MKRELISAILMKILEAALLTDKSLYFNANLSESSIFEVGMTASEFTDTGEFAKYDPQNEGWEEF